jgi:hypothetical protein
LLLVFVNWNMKLVKLNWTPFFNAF